MTTAARARPFVSRPHACGVVCRLFSGGWESVLVDRLTVLAAKLHRHPGHVHSASTARLRLVKVALEQVFVPIADELGRSCCCRHPLGGAL